MGWAGGSYLMNTIISSFERTIGQSKIPEDAVIEFWKLVIKEFENDDWDTQNESIGRSDLWDKAYFAEHPYDDGYYQQATCRTNPYKKGSKQAQDWQAGYEDALRELED